MTPQEVAVAPNIRVILESSTQDLDEIIVTGYGNFKKSSFTGSASVVSIDKVMDVPTVSIQDKLAGTVSGVLVTSTSGQPGAVESVRIRGTGSMNAGNDPLYVVDGVPIFTGKASAFSYADTGSSLLSTLNSNDIESMTVIKDAAAASLYGSRAANGVIVITTKKGKSGKTRFNAKADWGFSDMAVNFRPVLNGQDRREVLHLGLQNYATNNGIDDAKGYADREIDSYAAEPWSGYTDWRDIMLRNGSYQSYELNAQGGNDKTNFYTSLSYTKQEGITMRSGYDRFTGRVNLTHRENRVTIEASSLFSRSDQDLSSEGTSYSNPMMTISMTVSPSSYPYNEDGTLATSYFPAANGANPLASAMYNFDKNLLHRSLSSASLTWNVWDNLNVKEVISYDFNQSNNRVWWDARTGDGRTANGNYQRYMINRTVLNTQTQITYNTTFAEAHNLDVLLGFETEEFKRDYTFAAGSQYPSDQPEITNAGETRGSSLYDEYRLASYLGRVNYDYLSKYYVSASFRRDGSSRLSNDNRWGDFWSLSGSWRLSQESFMQGISAIVNDAKIRASYGVNGTQPTDYYGYLGLFRYGYRYNGASGSSEYALRNLDLKWEKNYSTNIGIDLTFLNRFSMTAEWYNRETKDLIMEKPISGTVGIINTSGNALHLINVGAMRNRGIELELKSTNIQNKNLIWTSGLTLAHNNNTLVKLDGEQEEMIDDTGFLIHREGQPFYSFYGYEYAGVDPATGKESFYINRDGSREITTVISEADKILMGSAQPSVQGGITNYVQWKFIDFNLTLTYSLGGKAYDRATWVQSNGGSWLYNGNVPSYYKIGEMWQNPGDHAKLPQFVYGNTNYISSRWILSTNHLRVKNMTVGFTLPADITKKAGLEKVRAYASANNLLTWKKKGMYVDPETPVDGLTRFETPPLRTVTFGIEIGF